MWFGEKILMLIFEMQDGYLLRLNLCLLWFLLLLSVLVWCKLAEVTRSEPQRFM